MAAEVRQMAIGRLIVLALAAGVPFAAYLATASAHSYWLDGGEFVAAAVGLGVAHPPGHPLASVLGYAASLIPFGPIALRVALLSALLTALAAVFLFRALDTTALAMGLHRARARWPLALAGTWLVALSYGWWFQAVRPEVYALQAALVTLGLERFVAIEGRAPVYDLRPAYVGMLALGFALANHHFLALLALPAVAPTLARMFKVRGSRPLLWSFAAVAAGLSTYLYLPLRAWAEASPNLGDPSSPARFFWVVSAQAFQKNTGTGVPLPLFERFAQVAEHAVRDLGFGVIALAAAGIYPLLRLPSARRVGYIWLATLMVYVAARAWLGFVRANPDALGYLMPAYGALAALAVAFAAAILAMVLGHRPGRARLAVATILAVLLPVLPLLRVPKAASKASLAAFDATDSFDDPLRRDLPARAVLLAHAPQTVFRLWGGAAQERLRPDVTVVPMPFLAYPGMIEELLRDAPELREVLRGYRLEGEVRQPDLQSLAARRPLLVELDPRVPPELYETLVPDGLYHEVLADGATDTDERLGAQSQAEVFAELYSRLGAADFEPRTREQLLWRHYMNAIYFAGFGDRDAARREVRLGLALDPHARELRGLGAALRPARTEDGEEETGPIDVRPFLVGEEVARPAAGAQQ